MRARLDLLGGTLLLGALLAACGPVKQSYEKFILRGTIVKKEGAKVTVGIGSADRVKVGQVLQVYRSEGGGKDTQADGSGYSTPSRPQTERVMRGKIRITSIVGDTMAEAEIVEGQVEANDLVDLRNPVQ